MGKDPVEAKQGNHSKQGAYEIALKELSSNLFAWLVKRDFDMRFLRFKWKDEGEVLAIIGVYDEVGAELVAFGSGGSYIEAMAALGRTLAANNFRDDKPWKPKQ